MDGREWIRCVLAAGLVASWPNASAAQVSRFKTGAHVPNLLRMRPAPDPADARLLAPSEFSRLSRDERRRVIHAWAAGTPELAGNAILPLLEAALLDSDPEVRGHAMRALQRVEFTANVARRAGTFASTDPSAYSGLRSTLIRLLDDPDPRFRGKVVDALRFLAPSGDPALEALILRRLRSESAPQVKARMVALLGAGVNGSPSNLSAVLDALNDRSPEVSLAAINAMRMSPQEAALPDLVKLLTRPEDWHRLAVVKALREYGDRARPFIQEIRRAFEVETDPIVKNQLDALLMELSRS